MRLILLLSVALAGCEVGEATCIDGRVYTKLQHEKFYRPTMSTCKILEENK